jgi:hypothetical protein
MATETAPSPGTAVPRECGCPACAVRCAHWDGKVVWLVNYRYGRSCLAAGRHLWRWHVRGPCVLPLEQDHIPWGGFHVSAAKAEADFRRREAELLGRAE